MGDHFVLLVDRLLTESTLEAAIIERENQLQKSRLLASQDNMISSLKIDVNISSSSGKLVECRICHDEDEELNMETPCSCRGSLKVSQYKSNLFCCYMLIQSLLATKLGLSPAIHCARR